MGFDHIIGRELNSFTMLPNLEEFLYSIGVDIIDNRELAHSVLTNYLEEGTVKFSPTKSSLKGVIRATPVPLIFFILLVY